MGGGGEYSEKWVLKIFKYFSKTFFLKRKIDKAVEWQVAGGGV